MNDIIDMNKADRRKATWYKCGTDIIGAKSTQEALEKSGLNYKVEKAPLFLENGYKVPGQFCTKKENTNEVFGVVGAEYSIVQNSEAFDFVNEIIPQGLSLEKAGENNRYNWILGSLPEQYILGDNFTPYVIFQNSHAGGSAVRACISTLRMACSNQFTMAWKQATGRISLRHSGDMESKLHTAQEVLRMTAESMDTMRVVAEEMATQKVSNTQIITLLENMFPIMEDFTERKRVNAMLEREAFTRAYYEDDLANFRNTQWGLLNAYSDFITHREPGRVTKTAEESRFTKVSFDQSLMENFVKLMKAV